MGNHYNTIEKALQYIDNNFKEQPSLDDIAKHIHLSSHHFQRVFSEWAGISPKKYLQFLSVNYAKRLLQEEARTLFDTALDSGFSSTSRLHDLFVNIEGMTPGEYKNEGANLSINYSFAETRFGDILVASTQKGICFLSFIENATQGFAELTKEFPRAKFQEKSDKKQKNALLIFQDDWSDLQQLKLHLKGTPFQLKVWEALLSIPRGRLTTYGKISEKINNPKAIRAVGTAIGSNPVAYLIPCHRVIQSSGKISGYRWNPIRKKAIIGWEAAQLSSSEN